MPTEPKRRDGPQVKVQVTIRLDPETYKRVRVQTKKSGVSANAFIEYATLQQLARDERQR